VISEVAYRFGDRNIRPLFIQMVLGQYSAFCVFHTLLGVASKQKPTFFHFYWAMLIFHVGFIVVLCLGMTWEYGAFCGDQVVYPWIISVADILFLFSYIFVIIATKKGYWIQWKKRVCSLNQNAVVMRRREQVFR